MFHCAVQEYGIYNRDVGAGHWCLVKWFRKMANCIKLFNMIKFITVFNSPDNWK